MYLTMFERVEKVGTPGLTIELTSLYSAFEQVADGRKAKGKRYPLPLLLTLLMLGKLAGETTVNGIVDWINERQSWLRTQLNWPKRFPTNSTYSEALARCDAEQVVSVIANVLLKARAVEQCGSEPSRKENEISAAAALLHPALVKGRIISTDALHTQKKWCACVHVYDGYYLTIVKKKQPQMYQDLVDFFDDPEAEQEEWQSAKSVQKGHGRLELREIWESHADECVV